jgi:methylglutaconyl-CoA hydratase
MSAPPISLVSQGSVVHIVLSTGRPGNPLEVETLGQLRSALAAAAQQPTCRVIVLRGEGGFCTGLDLRSLVGPGPRPQRERLRAAWHSFLDCLDALRTCPRPVLARVEGEAAGGGVGLAAACDLVLASTSARFVLPEVVWGLYPATIVPYLRLRVAPGRLRALAVGSRALPAAEAHLVGLVDELAVSEKLEVACQRQVLRLSRSHPEALVQARRLSAGPEPRPEAERHLEELLEWLERPEVLRGVQELLEGRAPPWFPSRQEGGNE